MGFSSCGSRALEHKLNSCGTGAWLLRGMWGLPRPEIEPESPDWLKDSLPLIHQWWILLPASLSLPPTPL